MRYIFLAFGLSVIFATKLSAQWTITGSIQDQASEEPLPGAYITIEGNSKGTVADVDGRFLLKANSRQPTIVIRCIGYKPYSQKLELSKHFPHNFFLVPAPLSLPTTTIVSEGVQRVHPGKQSHVVDYEFLGKNILMIVYDPSRKRNVLQLFSSSRHLLAERDTPDNPPRSLVADCMGAKHCLSEDFASQIDFANGELILRRDSIETFDRVVRPCLAENSQTYYYGLSPHSYARGFTFKKGETSRSQYLFGTIHERALKVIRDEQQMRMHNNANQSVSMESSFASSNAMRGQFQAALDAQYLSKIQFPPIYVPLLIVRNEVFIFDHPHNLIARFDNDGHCLDTIPMSYNKMRNWTRMVIVDEEADEAYTFSEKNGFKRLHRIDLETGDVTQAWDFPKQYVQKVKIKDGYIYYTWRDNYDNGIKRLYRMKM